MTGWFYFRALTGVMALVAVSAIPSVPMAQVVPLSEGAPVSGGVVSQSGDCPGGPQQDEHCLPGGPGSPPARPGGPIHPPVTSPVPPSVTPPVMPPAVLPPGILLATQSEDPELPLIIIIFGSAKATLHVKDDSQDVTYVSSRANLRFEPRDPAHPAQGCLNVVGLTGGDFHSVLVSAFNPNPDVAFTKTCPGNPPQVAKYASQVHWLLHILSQPTLYEGSTVVFKGQKSYDQGNRMDFLNLLPPGTQLPQIALDALSQTSSAPGIRLYTWEWELKPLTSGQTGGN